MRLSLSNVSDGSCLISHIPLPPQPGLCLLMRLSTSLDPRPRPRARPRLPLVLYMSSAPGNHPLPPAGLFLTGPGLLSCLACGCCKFLQVPALRTDSHVASQSVQPTSLFPYRLASRVLTLSFFSSPVDRGLS